MFYLLLMGQKIREIVYSKNYTQFLYNCPGCGYEHAFSLRKHEFNGDLNNPTVMPSLLEKNNPARVCHSYITDGKIAFQGDSWHELKGQTVDLPDYTEETGKRLVMEDD